MATQGILWFPDLLLPDSTFILPILSAFTWLWNVEMAAGEALMIPIAQLSAGFTCTLTLISARPFVIVLTQPLQAAST